LHAIVGDGFPSLNWKKVQVFVFSGAASSLATVLGARILGPDEPKS
jgi:hypothetical protein